MSQPSGIMSARNWDELMEGIWRQTTKPGRCNGGKEDFGRFAFTFTPHTGALS